MQITLERATSCPPFSEGLNPPLSTVSIFFNLSLTGFLFCDFVVPHELFPGTSRTSHFQVDSDPGEGTPCNGPYGEAPSGGGAFFRLQVYEKVGIGRVICCFSR